MPLCSFVSTGAACKYLHIWQKTLQIQLHSHCPGKLSSRFLILKTLYFTTTSYSSFWRFNQDTFHCRQSPFPVLSDDQQNIQLLLDAWTILEPDITSDLQTRAWHRDPLGDTDPAMTAWDTGVSFIPHHTWTPPFSSRTNAENVFKTWHHLSLHSPGAPEPHCHCSSWHRAPRCASTSFYEHVSAPLGFTERKKSAHNRSCDKARGSFASSLDTTFTCGPRPFLSISEWRLSSHTGITQCYSLSGSSNPAAQGCPHTSCTEKGSQGTPVSSSMVLTSLWTTRSAGQTQEIPCLSLPSHQADNRAAPRKAKHCQLCNAVGKSSFLG